MGSPSGQISFVSNLRDPQINEALSTRRMEITAFGSIELLLQLLLLSELYCWVDVIFQNNNAQFLMERIFLYLGFVVIKK